MALNAYIDGSGTGDSQFLVLAGYIATADTWMKFSEEWRSRLSQAGVQHLKMRDFASRPEIAGWFYRIVEEHDIKAAVSCVIHTDELIKVNRSINYPPYIVGTEKMDNPYYFAVKGIVDVLAQHQQELGLNEPVDFIFDDEGEKSNILPRWHLIKLNSEPQYAALMGGIPTWQDDKKCMPLQAADLYAWWILKWEREGNVDAVKDLPFPWGANRSIPRLATRFRERDFLAEVSRGLAKHARSQADLEYAQSLLVSPPSGEEGDSAADPSR